MRRGAKNLPKQFFQEGERSINCAYTRQRDNLALSAAVMQNDACLLRSDSGLNENIHNPRANRYLGSIVRDAEWFELTKQFESACNQEVPNLLTIKRIKSEMMNHIVDSIIAELEKPPPPVSPGPHLELFTNLSPSLSPRRCLASPLRTPEICQFEARLREVFGSGVEFSGTSWDHL